MERIFQSRSGADRRAQEIGPPLGWKERRRTVERRLPEVAELSFEECAALLAMVKCPSTDAGQRFSIFDSDPFAGMAKNDP